MIFLKFRRAQSTAEYVIVLGLVVGAIIAMQTYVKRGLQGRMRDASNYVENVAGDSIPTFNSGQFEPNYMNSNFETERKSYEDEKMAEDGTINRTLLQDEITNRHKDGYQRILAPQ